MDDDDRTTIYSNKPLTSEDIEALDPLAEKRAMRDEQERRLLEQYHQVCCLRCRKKIPVRVPDGERAQLCGHVTGFHQQKFCGHCAVFKQDCHCCKEDKTKKNKMHCRSCGVEISDMIDKNRERDRQSKMRNASDRRKKKTDGRIIKSKAA